MEKSKRIGRREQKLIDQGWNQAFSMSFFKLMFVLLLLELVSWSGHGEAVTELTTVGEQSSGDHKLDDISNIAESRWMKAAYDYLL